MTRVSSSVRLLHFAIRSTAWALAAAWTLKTLSVARNLHRVPNLATPPHDRSPQALKRVAVVVPARNEAANIGACLESLLSQHYPVQIIAIDDRSIDATGAILDDTAAHHPGRVAVLHISELPADWLGKTHAMHRGAELALARHHADYLLFTDGDVFFHPDAVSRAVAFAESTRVDHLVVMPSPILCSPGEAVILGFLQIIGFWALRPWRIPDPYAQDAIGVGAFNLLRASAYETLGGYSAFRYQIVEDVAMGRRVKRLGLRQQVAFAPGYIRLHWAAGVGGVIRTMTKNLFAIYGYRLPLVVASCAGLMVLCVGPFAGLGFRRMRLPSAVAVLAISRLYAIVSSVTQMPVWTVLGFPIGAVLLLIAIVRSTLTTLWRGGVEWRGTVYPLKELRAQTEAIAWMSLKA